MESELPTYSAPNSSNTDTLQASLLRVSDLSKQYVRGGLWRKRVSIAAASRVSFEIARGQTLALVGESGSGKSTVARCITRLERPDSGQIFFENSDIAQADSSRLLPYRSSVQIVFQDPVTSMNPRFSVREVLEEPLLFASPTLAPRLDRSNRLDLIRSHMSEVGLSPDWVDRSVLHFSGGQLQRLALARALIVRPKLLVLDEALSGLDLSTQVQIANLLLDLQAAHSLTYLLISHDLALVARLADVIAVMSEGRTVEIGPMHQITSHPAHAVTQNLLAAATASAAQLAMLARPS
jgi:oligopeptide transport system ATP-binding protein